MNTQSKIGLVAMFMALKWQILANALIDTDNAATMIINVLHVIFFIGMILFVWDS